MGVNHLSLKLYSRIVSHAKDKCSVVEIFDEGLDLFY